MGAENPPEHRIIAVRKIEQIYRNLDAVNEQENIVLLKSWHGISSQNAKSYADDVVALISMDTAEGWIKQSLVNWMSEVAAKILKMEN